MTKTRAKPIRIQEVRKVFGEANEQVVALDSISFEAEPGKFTCLMGASGSGKSTLLRIMTGIIPPTAGRVSGMSSNVGFVFQNFGLFPWLTANQNIAFGLKMQGLSKRVIDTAVAEQISHLGLAGFENTLPKELSGGMRQRVGIGRALAINPDILLLDEPFSALDEITAKQLRDDVLAIYKRRRQTIVMVTHLAEEAAYLADRIIVLTKRPSTVAAVLENKLPRPRNPRSAHFFRLVDEITQYLQS